MSKACPFCEIESSRILFENKYCFCIRDAFPVSPNHSLVIPKRHVKSFFDTTPEERNSLLSALNKVKEDLEQQAKPDGFNIGINDGKEAGQTVPHAHIHIIPRYEGDVDDPRGGIRWLFPEKANYWDATK